jgi:hypothetical protein
MDRLDDPKPLFSQKSGLQENFDKRGKKRAQITFPLRRFFPLKVVK